MSQHSGRAGRSPSTRRTMTTLDLSTFDHVLTTTRAVRKRLDLEPAGRARGDRGVPAARDPGADRRQLAGVALDRRDRPREARRARRAVPQDLAAVHRGGRAPPRPTPVRSRSACWTPRTTSPTSARGAGARDPVHLRPHAEGWDARRLGRARSARSIPRCGASSSRCAAAGSARCSPRCTCRYADAGRGAARHPRRRSRRPRSIPVAYFTGDDFKPAARRPVEEITYWNGVEAAARVARGR